MESYSSLKDLNLEGQVFSDKKEVKPWLLLYLFKSRGIKIVIERSDFHKIIFRCQDTREKKISHGQTRRHITCPFKIRANYSVRNKTWSITVLNEFHNHPIPTSNFLIRPEPSLSFSDITYNNDDELMKTSSSKALGFLNNDNDSSELSTADNLGHLNQPVESNHRKGGSTKGKILKPKPVEKNPLKEDKATPQLFDLLNDEYKDFEIANDVGKKINDLITRHISMNNSLNDDSKANIIRLVVDNMVLEHKESLNLSKLNSWLSSPHLTSHANTNLIPLSPLLNDSENEYPNGGSLNNALNNNHSTLDSLTLPMINSNVSLNNQTNLNNFIIPNQLQVQQIQNQNKQLPSFNSIQNNLPLSPGATSMNIYNTLPNPTSNNTSTTLNPNLLNPGKYNSGNSNTTSGNSYTIGSGLNTSSINNLLFDSKEKPNNFLNSLSTLLPTNLSSPSMVKSSPFNGSHDTLSFKIRNESDNE